MPAHPRAAARRCTDAPAVAWPSKRRCSVPGRRRRDNHHRDHTVDDLTTNGRSCAAPGRICRYGRRRVRRLCSGQRQRRPAARRWRPCVDHRWFPKRRRWSATSTSTTRSRSPARAWTPRRSSQKVSIACEACTQADSFPCGGFRSPVVPSPRLAPRSLPSQTRSATPSRRGSAARRRTPATRCTSSTAHRPRSANRLASNLDAALDQQQGASASLNECIRRATARPDHLGSGTITRNGQIVMRPGMRSGNSTGSGSGAIPNGGTHARINDNSMTGCPRNRAVARS